MHQDEQVDHLRHTAAHLLAAAVRAIYPGAQNAIGPAIEHGFYQDFDLGDQKVSDEDLPKIEAKMRELLHGWTQFDRREVTTDEATKEFGWNSYKTELIDEFAGEGKQLTFYTVGGFVDLCKGGHLEKPSLEMPTDSFKLDRVAGAYWRGDEKNKMLTRIYGLAFTTKVDLEAYLVQRAEAEKRDHRKLGKELGLFVFSELVGPGLPLFTPKGTMIRELLNDYVWQLRKVRGYQKVSIPHITKKELYETSGHWAKFADELYKITTRDKHVFALKPMNCPHHTQIFAAEPRSYRHMPQRYAETTMVYRDEQTGELSGLTRVLSITQDDAHVFCRESQIEPEVYAIWDIIDTFYRTFGFELQIRLSRHDPAQFEKYLGSEATWQKAEQALLQLMEKRGVTDYIDGQGEAAMYGPKIDFIGKDSLGRTHQVATIQLDFNQPQNFGLTCINEQGEKEPIVMIHAAIMGSIERFMSVLIEHVAGHFPFWLAPTQIKILPIADRHNDYAESIVQQLIAAGYRAVVDTDTESVGKKIRNAQLEKVPYMLVVGDKEIEAKAVAVRHREEGDLGAVSVADMLAKFAAEPNPLK